MKRMLRTILGAWAVALTVTTWVGAADDVADAPAALQPLAALVGEWTLDGNWSNGEALMARETMEWGLNRKFINVRTWVTRNDGSGEYERYQSVYGVKDGKIVLYNFAYDGDSSVDEVKVNGKVIDIRRKAKTPDGAEMVIRQEIEPDGKDKFRWRIWLDRDGNSQQIMDGVWVRKS